jgi:glycosyltransferase involved in cell wall biosynthesis
MHALFVHPNFPAQFGHVGHELAVRYGWRSTFVTARPPAKSERIERIQYRVPGGATALNHYCTRAFENATRHALGVYQALKARPDIRPDLIVGHSGFGTTLFLKELYPDVPVVNYFEYFYHTRGADMDFRPEFPSVERDRLRARALNATILLDLDNCDAGYSPTNWQHDRLPTEYRHKVSVIHDGIDTTIWKPDPAAPRTVGDFVVPNGMKVVTYATRGMESMRGFDIFVKAAARLARERSDVLFLVAGQDRVCYGGDARFTGGRSFKQWAMERAGLAPARVQFLGLLPPRELAKLFQITDCHVYLTVPFVLSWSLLNALACGAPVVASDTAPVREVIEHGRTGLLTDFFDGDALVRTIERVIDGPTAHRPLGTAGGRLVAERYSTEVCLPRLARLFEQTAGRVPNLVDESRSPML